MAEAETTQRPEDDEELSPQELEDAAGGSTTNINYNCPCIPPSTSSGGLTTT